MIFILVVIVIHWASSAIKNGFHHEMIAEVFKVSPGSTLVVSPLALSLPLYKLAGVSEGQTKSELITVLGTKEHKIKHFYNSDLKDSLETIQKTDLLMTNEIYVNYTDVVDKFFFVNSLNEYGVDVQKVGFASKDAAVNFINKRIATRTFRRIPYMLKPTDILNNTTMIITCALHLRTTWETPFYKQLTREENFYKQDGKIAKVWMMKNYDSVLYLEDDANDFSAVSIPFMTGQVSFTFFAPRSRTGLGNLLKKIAEDKDFLTSTRKAMKYTNVEYQIPRFKVKTLTDWTGFLKKIGVWNLFNCNSGELKKMINPHIDKNSPLCLHRAKSSVFIDVDEYGSFQHREVMPDDRENMKRVRTEHGASPDIVLDRPFYFTVAVHSNDYFDYQDLIHGTYYGPDT